jgi:hypothetical protein
MPFISSANIRMNIFARFREVVEKLSPNVLASAIASLRLRGATIALCLRSVFFSLRITFPSESAR